MICTTDLTLGEVQLYSLEEIWALFQDTINSKNLSKIKWPWVRHLNMSRWSLVKAFLPTAYWLYTFLKQSNTHLLTGDNHCFILIQYSYFCSQSRSKIVNKSTTTKPKYHLFFKSFCSSISITFSSFHSFTS